MSEGRGDRRTDAAAEQGAVFVHGSRLRRLDTGE
jgi:hypothetical protein